MTEQKHRWPWRHGSVALIGILTLLLGFAIAVQVHANSSHDALSGLRDEDLIGILDNIRGQLLVLSSAGRLLRTVSLEQAWGRKPHYLAGLSGGPDGGFIVNAEL